MKKRGRVLRLKTGYNPNSSSVGSHIPLFLFLASGASVLTVAVMHALSAAREKILRRASGESPAPKKSEE